MSIMSVGWLKIFRTKLPGYLKLRGAELGSVLTVYFARHF